MGAARRPRDSWSNIEVQSMRGVAVKYVWNIAKAVLQPGGRPARGETPSDVILWLGDSKVGLRTLTWCTRRRASPLQPIGYSNSIARMSSR